MNTCGCGLRLACVAVGSLLVVVVAVAVAMDPLPWMPQAQYLTFPRDPPRSKAVHGSDNL